MSIWILENFLINDVIKRQNEFLYKLSNIKIDKKTPEQRETMLILLKNLSF